MFRATRSATRHATWLRAVLATVLLAATVAVGALAVPSSTAVAAPRTWVVDAVDTSTTNIWESVDTGTSTVTIAAGDTVEWQFDRATMGHDLRSLEGAGVGDGWDPPIVEYRDPGGAPIRHTFDEPGTYAYVCSIHETTMTGTVVVTEAGANQDPTAAPEVSPTSGPAPLVVHATANASDPDDDPVTVSWTPGDGGAVATTDHAMLEYKVPGSYTLELTVSDGQGGSLVREFPITVTNGSVPPDPDPADDGAFPAIDALATPGQGTAPLAVAFSTQVTTTGTVRPFADATSADAGLTGTAVLVRRRGQTYTSLTVTGARAGRTHPVHVHEKSCADANGGAHFRFDTTQAFAEPNEIWPSFTADATGASGLVEVTKALRAGPLAVAVVVHDPDNPARRIGCADLVPGTAGLTYSWSFGDGTTGSGADPDHTYATPGAYTATVTVAHSSGAHAGHLSVSDSVQVVVGGGTPPAVVDPARGGPPGDSTGPRISRVRPTRAVSDRTPTVKAQVRDRDSRVRKGSIVLRLDGRRLSGVTYVAARNLVRWTPKKQLAPGSHVVRLVARDALGNRTVRSWRFTVRR